MDLMSRIWDTFPRIANRTVGPFLIPLSGFISNVNLTDFLAEEIACGQVRNYFRFSGTGILTPMMLGITTIGETFNLTTTSQRNVFSREEVSRIVAHIQWRLSGELDDLASQERFHQHSAKPVEHQMHPVLTGIAG